MTGLCGGEAGLQAKATLKLATTHPADITDDFLIAEPRGSAEQSRGRMQSAITDQRTSGSRNLSTVTITITPTMSTITPYFIMVRSGMYPEP